MLCKLYFVAFMTRILKHDPIAIGLHERMHNSLPKVTVISLL